MTKIFQFAVIVLVTLGTGAAAISVLNEDIPDLEVPEIAWVAGQELDGLTFRIRAVSHDQELQLDDDIVFRDGAFQSVDCQSYCDFGWTDYKTMAVDGVVHFTVRMVCPDAPHTVVWHGTVTGDEVALDVTWTTRRWYWTTQFRLAGTGQRVTESTADVQG